MAFRSGDWWLRSDTDSRWNVNGRTDCCGGFAMPDECREKIDKLKEELGDPPDDLTWNYMKD